jgi:hypothetical protein
MPPAVPEAQAALDFLAAARREHLLYEAIGLFWLWAEVVILFAMREARAVILLGATRPWRLRLLWWMAAFACFSIAVLARHYLLPAPPSAPDAMAAWYTASTRQHLAVWAAFVFGWVLLESLIVLEGVRAYRRFAVLCRAILRPAAVAVLLLAAASAAPQNASPHMAALLAADAGLQPWRNAVYLYLRIAGVAWIAVEWVAAILLWRGQALLWRAVREGARHA